LSHLHHPLFIIKKKQPFLHRTDSLFSSSSSVTPLGGSGIKQKTRSLSRQHRSPDLFSLSSQNLIEPNGSKKRKRKSSIKGYKAFHTEDDAESVNTDETDSIKDSDIEIFRKRSSLLFNELSNDSDETKIIEDHSELILKLQTDLEKLRTQLKEKDKCVKEKDKKSIKEKRKIHNNTSKIEYVFREAC